MKTPVLDFIDSETLRDHLKNQTLEPAIECILIARSRSCTIEKKLEALKERYDTYSAEDFNKGTYNCPEKEFKTALKDFIEYWRNLLADMYRSDDNYVYNAREIDTFGGHGAFTTFEAAIDEIKQNLTGNEFIIVKTRINEFETYTDIVAHLNERGKPYELWNELYCGNNLSIYGSYAWIPHRYAVGDIIEYDDNYPIFDTNGQNPLFYSFAVIVEDNRIPLTTSGLDMCDMSVRCVIFEKNVFHSCGGIFIQRDFPILHIESCQESWMDRCPKELIRFSHLIKGGISAAEFLEEYSQGVIGHF